MQIPISVSTKMESGSANEIPETKIIRVPSDLRELMGVELHTFLTLQTKDGKSISLIVEKAYKEDADSNPLQAYLTQETFSLLSNATEQNVEVCDDITYGCDPELLIVDNVNHGIVDAHKIFRKSSLVGSDGLLLELRPVPSAVEEVVIGNLFLQMLDVRKILAVGKNLFGGKFDGSRCALLARSYYSPTGTAIGGQYVGFHIHFGIPRALLIGDYDNVLKTIAMLLDYYVGVPSVLIEGEHDNARRCQTKIMYGKPGDWRKSCGNSTFEYRVPGGALMKTPETALGIMTVAGLVMEDIISRLKAATVNFTKMNNYDTCQDLRSLYPSVAPMMTIYSTICSPAIQPARDMMKSIYADFEKMVGFARRKQVIDSFLKLVSDPLQISEFVEKNWRVFYEQRQQRSMDVLQQPRTAGTVG